MRVEVLFECLDTPKEPCPALFPHELFDVVQKAYRVAGDVEGGIMQRALVRLLELKMRYRVDVQVGVEVSAAAVDADTSRGEAKYVRRVRYRGAVVERRSGATVLLVEGAYECVRVDVAKLKCTASYVAEARGPFEDALKEVLERGVVKPT